MLHETREILIDYKQLGINHNDVPATYTTYIHDCDPSLQKLQKRPMIVICPGGGYNHLSVREGEAIALKMMDLGYNSIIVRYSVLPNEYPCQLLELAYVVNLARNNHQQWFVDTDNIVVAGFSAGAHLAASLGTSWNKGYISDMLKVSCEAIKPNRMLLGYPVITSGEFAHQGSFNTLLGSRVDELKASMSIENNITKDTPECFIWHTFEDGTVPVENSLLLANALRKAGISFELHIFPCGSHGLALGTEETNTPANNKIQPEVSVWPSLFATWMNTKIQ